VRRRAVTVIVRRRRWFGWGTLLLVGVMLLGILGAAVWGHHFPLIGRGLLCAYHGAKAWIAARHDHPLWSAYHLWRATHDCHAAPWRF